MKTVVTEKCCLCGNVSEFKIKRAATLLREAGCSHCGVSLRTADVARVLVDTMGGGKRYETLAACVEDFADLQILNMFSEGRIHESLKEMKSYSFGEYFDNIKSGNFYNGVQCIDLQNIPFADHSFDIIVTEDILEHVEDIEKAFREINRVLKVGGALILTVPIHEKNITISRKGNENKVYHGDPLREKGALVVTDFGNDIIEMLRDFGMDAREVVAHRFFEPEEISYIDEEYDHYQMHQQDLCQAFRYNSIVYVGKKVSHMSIDKARGTGVWQRLVGWFK